MENRLLSLTHKKKSAKLNQLIQTIADSKESNFYKNIWGNACVKNDKIDFGSLPTISAKDIMKCKFDERIYIKRGLFVKIVYKNNAPFLVARTRNDIKKEEYGEIMYERPLVFFLSSHESIEKSLWLYSKNILPLIAEDNIITTSMSAGRYEIDSIVGDVESIKKIRTEGFKYFNYKNIINVTVIDSCFVEYDINSLKNSFPNALFQLIFSLPDTGSLGQVCKENTDGATIFHSTENTIIEISKNGYVVATRLIMLPTPIIKYKTEIKARAEEKYCSCESELSFSLEK